jgi:hypothetical protein
MWHGMRLATFEALKKVVDSMKEKGKVPKEVLIIGFSIGDWMST